VLRVGFLPSDFNPMVLMLGEAADFRALAGALRQFARDPAELRLDRLGFCRSGIALAVVAADGAEGIARVGDGAFAWRLTTARAEDFAARAEALSDPSLPSGSDMLECGTEEGIPAKLSRGEYTDEFLAA
jgi:hypothetical protein